MPGMVKRVRTPCLDISCENYGDPRGPAVLLVHGFPDDVRTWSSVIDAIVDAGYRALVPVPTVLLCGAEDGANLPEASEGKERYFTAAYARQVIPGVGHFVQRESPRVVADAILGFHG